jgi:hypothetical protein
MVGNQFSFQDLNMLQISLLAVHKF